MSFSSSFPSHILTSVFLSTVCFIRINPYTNTVPTQYIANPVSQSFLYFTWDITCLLKSMQYVFYFSMENFFYKPLTLLSPRSECFLILQRSKKSVITTNTRYLIYILNQFRLQFRPSFTIKIQKIEYLYYCSLMMVQVGAETSRPIISLFIKVCWLWEGISF
jgi:hypothetical protein